MLRQLGLEPPPLIVRLAARRTARHRPPIASSPKSQFCVTSAIMVGHARVCNKADLGYSFNRTSPAQRVALGRSDLTELNQRPGPMTFSYRSCSTYMNSPEADIASPAPT
jgi:hypothetical protein